ncbi:hypothetical protein ASPFODRAFT_437949 [Aspergillus luchuensis CBS 106.47]|uniref:Uncharacterized protein n=1 Tax=Aspergillus luchuensis (strain CBS 106.47) TaxID=1137211 RepID=A0A1M3TW32_ASPLC|nr:hypothetical protein ASPFODRAFT_437949 [Aspergillus luchuensis CBS 106.47]
MLHIGFRCCLGQFRIFLPDLVVCVVTAYTTTVVLSPPLLRYQMVVIDSFPMILEKKKKKKKISLSRSTENQNLGITSAGEASYTNNVIWVTFFR